MLLKNFKIQGNNLFFFFLTVFKILYKSNYYFLILKIKNYKCIQTNTKCMRDVGFFAINMLQVLRNGVDIKYSHNYRTPKSFMGQVFLHLP